MGRADDACRERPSRRLSFGRRSPARPASPSLSSRFAFRRPRFGRALAGLAAAASVCLALLPGAAMAAPMVSKATLEGTALKVTFSEALSTSVPATSAFAVELDGAAQTLATNNPVTISGSTVTLTLASAPGAGVVRVSYTKPTTGTRLQNSAGTGDVESFADRAVARPAKFVSAVVHPSGRGVIITFDKVILNSGATHGFRITVAGNDRTPINTSWRDNTVSLVLSSALAAQAGQTVTVSYTKPTGFQHLVDADELLVANFTNEAVTNAVGSPTATGATVNGKTLAISFSENLNTTQVPSANRFRYTRGDSAIEYNPRSVAISGSTVTLTLRHTIVAHETVTMRYDAPPGNPRLQTTTGGVATLSFSLDEDDVTNNTTDVKAPTVVSGITFQNGEGVGLTHSEDMKVTGIADRHFTVKVDGATRSLSNMIAGGNVTQLLLSSPVTHGQRVTVSYSGTGQWQDLAGNRMAAFTDFEVENREPAPATIESVAITSTPSADQTYKRKELIEVTVTYDKDVTWDYSASGAQLRVRLRVGTAAKSASLVTGGPLIGTARALKFRYRVGAGDSDTDGVAVEKVSDELVVRHSGAKLKAADGAAASVAHDGLAADANHKVNATLVDNTAPTVSSRTVDGDTLTLTYNERLRESSVPAAGRFDVRVGVTLQRTVRSVAVSGTDVILTLASATVQQEDVRVSYTQSGTKIEDLAGNDAANFSSQVVSNPDRAPRLASAKINATRMILTFDEALNASNVPALSRFVVRKNGVRNLGSQYLSGTVAISDKTATLTLASTTTLDPSDVITISYSTFAGPNTLQDANGNRVASFTDAPVTNELTDADRPTVQSGTVSGRTIALTFNKTLKAPPGASLRQAFILGRRGHEDQHPSAVAVSGSTVTLTLSDDAPIKADENFYLSYFPEFADADDRLQATSGPRVAKFVNFVPTDNTPSGTGGPGLALGPTSHQPTIALLFARGTGQTSVIRVAMDEPLDPASAPAGSAFEVRVWNSNEDLTRIAGTGTANIVGSEVEVALASRVEDNSTAAVYYKKPSTNPLQDLAGNDANDFFTNRVMVVDENPPTRLASVAAGSKLTLYYHEELDADSVPATSDLTASVDGVSQTVNAVAIVGNAVELTLASAPAAGKLVVYTYTAGTFPIRDAAGNEAADISSLVWATAKGPTDPGKPALATTDPAVANGTTVTLTFDKELDPAFVPPPSAFALPLKLLSFGTGSSKTWETEPGYSPFAVTRVAIEGKKVLLHLQGPVRPCAFPFTVTYTKPAANALRNIWGTEADAITGKAQTATQDPTSGQAVTNANAANCVNGIETARVGSIILTAKRPLATDAPPQAAWFSAAASGGPVTVTGAAFVAENPRELKLSLSREFAADETVTVSYTRPAGARGLWDVDGNQLRNVADMPVTNGAPVPARFVSASVPVHGTGVTLTFSKNISSAGLHRHYTVSIDGAARETTRAFWTDNTVGLVLTEPVGAGAAVEVSYAQPTEGVGALLDVDELRVASFGPEAAENTVPAPAPERAALTASFVGVPAEHDGESRFTFELRFSENFPGPLRYKMLRDEALRVTNGRVTAARRVARGQNQRWTVEVEPASLGDVVVTLPAATDCAAAGAVCTEAGRKLSNTATATVAGVAPLTATFIGVPAEHDGRSRFTFELRFSENFPGRFPYKVLKDRALQVTNGRVVSAARVARGQNQRWTIAVRPTALEAVTVTLPATTDCAAPGAVCTEAGRKLSNTATATVLGPALLTVADAEVQEGPEAAMAFAVRLSRAASATVTVDYATADGTATAGEDYTATSGTLTFAAGETGKTVEVPVLDDALDEGSETFVFRLSNAAGARITDGEATGTIKNSDPLQKMWLSRFGRTVADHVTAAVSDRLANPLTGAQVTVGGQTVNLAEAGDDAFLGRTLTSIARIMGAPSGPAPANDAGSWPGAGPGSGPLGSGPLGSGPAGAGPWPGTGLGLRDSPTLDGAPARSISGRDLLLGSAFHLAREGDGATPGLAAWGRVTVGGFDGEAPADSGNVRIDGNVTTGILGTDAEWNRLLAGVAVSVSEGEGTFDQPGVDSGTIESTMTTVSPYARVTLSERVSVWGLAGYGTGDMTIVQAANDATGQPERITRTDLSMRLAALGGRGALLTPEQAGGFDLALKADGFFVETTSEAVSNEGDTSADASRVRLALEGSRAFQMGGGVLTPGLELGLRHDGGDAETGTGVELGGRLSYADQATGLSVEANVRALVAHEDSKYREWGASGAVRLAPGERGRGPSFSLAPTYGTPSGGVEQLWSARDARGLAPDGGTFEPESRLEGELGYGLALLGDRFTGTPNVGFGLSGAGARDYRIGWRFSSAVPGDPGFEVTLDATRREPANDNGADTPVEHGVMLRAAIRW